jgi:alcohol dehydrogenase (cytochrome c)
VSASDYRVRWREAIIFDKATGQLNEIGWPDLLRMLRPGSLAYKGNPFEVIESPRRSKDDLEVGEELYRKYCTSCHGDQARGSLGGPSLQGRIFRQGSSDLALYRTIKLGIPSTPMAGKELLRDDIWRLVSYLNSILANQSVTTSTSGQSPRSLLEPITAAQLRGADKQPAEWLTYSGSYDAHRHSGLHQINRDNVGMLRVEWVRQLSTTADRVETSPIIRGSMMFVTDPPNRVQALDAASGQEIWTYTHDLPSRLTVCCGPHNRGVALLGDYVFVGTLDAHLVALDARTGDVVWDVAVADPSNGYAITGAPLAVDDMVITGVAGADYGARGFLDAYDAATGKRRWRFYTVPTAGQPGSETWGGRSGAGGSTWLTGSYDPDLRLIYWGVGNPSPSFYGEGRSGDNLYSASVIAVDADTGMLRWHFQFTPHDLHDWDAVQIPVLVDAAVGNVKRRLLALANRNAFYYLLDRETGEFLLGTPFVKQTWANGLDASGRPSVRPESAPTREGTLVYPGVGGGTNWWSPTYDPELNLMYVPTLDWGGIFFASPERPFERGGETLAGWDTPNHEEKSTVAVKALEVTTGRVRWQYVAPSKTRVAVGGLMSTAGQLVFGGSNETLFALDARTGAELWRFEAGGWISAAPVSYELGGRQYIAVAVGRNILAFALPPMDTQNNVQAGIDGDANPRGPRDQIGTVGPGSR